MIKNTPILANDGNVGLVKSKNKSAFTDPVSFTSGLSVSSAPWPTSGATSSLSTTTPSSSISSSLANVNRIPEEYRMIKYCIRIWNKSVISPLTAVAK